MGVGMGMGGGMGGGGGGGGGGSGAGSRTMRLDVVTPVAPWMYAVYKPKVKKGCPPEPPPWEVSWIRFQQRGESVETIAMTQTGGTRAVIQKSTVVGHLLEALMHGKPVDFARLRNCGGVSLGDGHLGLAANPLILPNEDEWRALEYASVTSVMDPRGEPSGFANKEVLKGVLGAAAVDKDRESKTEEEKAMESAWYFKIRVWTALKRAEYTPQWIGGGEPVTKKLRVCSEL